MPLVSKRQYAGIVASIFLCTVFAIVSIPSLTTSKYNPNVIFNSKYDSCFVSVVYFGGIQDTIHIKLMAEPYEEALRLNGKGCLVKERSFIVESLKCGVREYRILATKPSKHAKD